MRGEAKLTFQNRMKIYFNRQLYTGGIELFF